MNKEPNVQVCDATGDEQSAAAGYKKISPIKMGDLNP